MQPTASYRLLVVDDEVAVLKLVKHMLTRAGYDAVTCVNAEEAMAALSENTFDCVITDAIMPGVSGYDLVKLIRGNQDFAGVPILMLTRKRHRQDVKKAVDVGVTDYVLKPIDEHLLLDKVELCLKKGGGKRSFYEIQLNGKEADAKIVLNCSISAMSESDMTLRTSIPVHSTLEFEIKSKLLDEIGCKLPILQPISVKEVSPDSPGAGPLPYEIKFSFIGGQETELKKIRSWIQKEEIRRRK